MFYCFAYGDEYYIFNTKKTLYLLKNLSTSDRNYELFNSKQEAEECIKKYNRLNKLNKLNKI